MDFFQEYFQYHTTWRHALDVVYRTSLLFIIDFLINGGFLFITFDEGWEYIPFEPHHAAFIGKPAIHDILFATERLNMTDTFWAELAWTSYSILNLFYFAGLVFFIILFFAEGNFIIFLLDYTIPLCILAWSFTYATTSSTSLFTLFSPTQSEQSRFRSFVTYFLNVALRALYGYAAGGLYLTLRLRRFWPTAFAAFSAEFLTTIKNFASFLVRIPFFLPFIQAIFSNTNSSLTAWYAIFAPILVLEICIFRTTFDALFSYIYRYLENMNRRINEIGLTTVINDEWTRLRLTNVFQSFWLVRVSMHILYAAYIAFIHHGEDPYGIFETRKNRVSWIRLGLDGGSWSAVQINNFETNDQLDGFHNQTEKQYEVKYGAVMEYLMMRCCETAPAILATTAIIAYVAKWAVFLFRCLLTGEHRRARNEQDIDGPENADADVEMEDELNSVGTLTGVLFLILCLQTGLTGLSAEKRLIKLCRNLWLLAMVILHFEQQIVDNTLIRLCTTGRHSVAKHARAIFLGLFLLTTPYFFFTYAWRRSNWLNPWLISVALFAAELTAKMFISFLMYAVMLFDLRRPYASTYSEDLLYWIKSTGAVLEFIFGIFLCINGIWILFYEHGGVVRACMICVHAYVNIYERGRKGYGQWRRRRDAARYLESFRRADQNTLREHADEVCCVCYEKLVDASNGSSDDIRIIACNHLFHGVCLMKWLYVRLVCPLCHTPINIDSPPATAN